MAYVPQKDVVLTGSLNLLPPGNLIPKEDALVLKNWRVDQAGALRSRQGSSLLATIPGYVHSLYRRENTRYFGSDGNLYRKAGAGDPTIYSTAATGFDGKPLGFAASDGYLWVMNRGNQGRDNGTDFLSWLPDPPASLATPTLVAGGELVVGVTYTYYVTFLTADGHETNPAEAPVTIAAAGTQTARIARPASSDARITSGGFWNIYRTGNTLPDAYRINTAPISYGTTTFDDTGSGAQSDEEVARLGIALEVDHDAPPDASGLAGPYYGRLIAFSSALHPNWIWWTAANRPYMFPADNHAPVGEDGEEILAITQHGRQLRIYKTRSIWRALGDPGDPGSVLEMTNEDIGLIGSEAICSQGDIDYFQAGEGVYAGNGDIVRKISPQLDPLFRGESVHVGDGIEHKPLHADPAYRAAAALEIKNGRLYYSYPDITAVSARNNSTLVYDLASGRWYSDSRAFHALFYEGQNSELVCAPANFPAGGVYALESGDRSNESHNVSLGYQSGYRDQGTRDRQKTYADLVIEHSVQRGAAANYDLTVKGILDDGLDFEAIGSIGVATTGAGDNRARSIFQINGDEGLMARNLAVRIEGDCPLDVTIYSIELHYYLEARDAKTFDSDEGDFGYPGVKDLDTLQLDIDAPGAFTFDILTDLPGGAMTSRYTATVPLTAGREMVEIPLTVDGAGASQDISGKLIRLLLSTETSFRVYGVRFRYRPLGLYRDGANGEVWETQDIGLGI